MNNLDLEQSINWYPGHMKKTTDEIKKDLQLVDIVVEIIDARAPISTKNPEIDSILNQKEKIIIMSKSDLAREDTIDDFIKYYSKDGIQCVKANLSNKDGINNIVKILNSYKSKIREKNKEKNLIKKSLSMMIVGIPNVGKSTFINAISGEKKVKAANTPGVTKKKQWITLKNNFRMLDTAGILPPKIQDEKQAVKLAILGSIKDRLLDIEEIYYMLIKLMLEKNNSNLFKTYEIKEEKDFEKISEIIARKRGFLLKGNEIDYNRLANAIISEFRTGKYGRIQLDKI